MLASLRSSVDGRQHAKDTDVCETDGHAGLQQRDDHAEMRTDGRDAARDAAEAADERWQRAKHAIDELCEASLHLVALENLDDLLQRGLQPGDARAVSFEQIAERVPQRSERACERVARGSGGSLVTLFECVEDDALRLDDFAALGEVLHHLLLRSAQLHASALEQLSAARRVLQSFADLERGAL